MRLASALKRVILRAAGPKRLIIEGKERGKEEENPWMPGQSLAHGRWSFAGVSEAMVKSVVFKFESYRTLESGGFPSFIDEKR